MLLDANCTRATTWSVRISKGPRKNGINWGVQGSTGDHEFWINGEASRRLPFNSHVRVSGIMEKGNLRMRLHTAVLDETAAWRGEATWLRQALERACGVDDPSWPRLNPDELHRLGEYPSIIVTELGVSPRAIPVWQEMYAARDLRRLLFLAGVSKKDADHILDKGATVARQT